MDLNADFTARAVVHAAGIPWVASPMRGVDRRMLDRMGDEVARATTIVRYAPGSAFSAHVHSGGEEFVVLSGTFQDEHGDYPAGSYVRNPPQSSHTPSSVDGCVILVKLWQFDPDDRTAVTLRPDNLQPIKVDHATMVTPLHRDAHEAVTFVDLAADARMDLSETLGGHEVFVIAGGFTENGDAFKQHSWLRLPAAEPSSLRAGPDGARLWVKTGHLRKVPTAP